MHLVVLEVGKTEVGQAHRALVQETHHLRHLHKGMLVGKVTPHIMRLVLAVVVQVQLAAIFTPKLEVVAREWHHLSQVHPSPTQEAEEAELAVDVPQPLEDLVAVVLVPTGWAMPMEQTELQILAAVVAVVVQ